MDGVQIYGCQNNTYRLLASIPSSEDAFPASISNVIDMNLDGIPEIVIEEGACMQGECKYARVYEWDGKQFENLVLSAGDPDIRDTTSAFLWPGRVNIIDTDRNGTLELVLTGGNPIGANVYTAGPSRIEIHVFMWNGENFVFYGWKFESPEYRFQALQDGDRASQNGEYDIALEAYQQAIFDDQLKPWSQALREHYVATGFWDNTMPTPTPPAPDPAEYPNLAAYARYRILLLHIVRGYLTDAQVVYLTLQDNFPAGQPGHVYAEMARAFWEEYQASGKVGQACAKAIAFANAQPANVLMYLGNNDYSKTDYGLQSHTYTPQDLCPFK